MSLKLRRIVQIIFALAGGMMGLSVAAHTVGNWSHAGAAGLAYALFPVLFAMFPVGVLEWQIRSIATAGRQVRAFIDQCAKTTFDAPGAVRPGYDLSATAGPLVTLLASESDNGAAFTTDGTYRGARISVASHVSTIGRQVGEFHHTYSHVVVDVLGLERPFRLSRERVGSKLAKAVGASSDANVGDEAFDKMFNIECDEAFARDVLDDSIRERLMKLQSQVSLVSADFRTGGMSLLLSKRGLALRWPGDMQPGLAIAIRDLLLDIRERMLAHENRKAARVGDVSAGYRISADAAPGAREEEAEASDDEAARARAARS